MLLGGWSTPLSRRCLPLFKRCASRLSAVIAMICAGVLRKSLPTAWPFRCSAPTLHADSDDNSESPPRRPRPAHHRLVDRPRLLCRRQNVFWGGQSTLLPLQSDPMTSPRSTAAFPIFIPKYRALARIFDHVLCGPRAPVGAPRVLERRLRGSGGRPPFRPLDESPSSSVHALAGLIQRRQVVLRTWTTSSSASQVECLHSVSFPLALASVRPTMVREGSDSSAGPIALGSSAPSFVPLSVAAAFFRA